MCIRDRFTIDDPETRATNAQQAKDKLAALESGEWDGSEESDETPVEEPMPETNDGPVVETPDILGDLLDD